MYFVKTPWLLRQMYPSLTWQIPSEKKDIYLTFDDGPHPAITPFVLDTLSAFGAKATFFCIGKNVENNTALYQRIIDEGHAVGNHTYNHVNGWKTTDEAYFNEVIKTKEVVDSKLFRPPYGRISRFQIQQLKKLFNIIMWDVLSGDFDRELSPEVCLKNVISNTRAGSIVVFHDSEKAAKKLEYTLPKTLGHLLHNGFTCKAITL